MATTSAPLTLDCFSTRICTHGLDEASDALAPLLSVRYVQLERGMPYSSGAMARLGANRNKVEWLDVPRGQVLIVVSICDRARLGTTGIEPNIATFERYARRMIDAAEAAAPELAESADALLTICNAWLQEGHDDERTLPASTARCQAAVRARQYIDDHLDRPLTLAHVCQASYASPRALEYGFREIFGVSPIAYIRCARLSRVRRELCSSAYMSGRITQLAMKWGFWHLSQFSKDYYDLFGELPSITLGRANGRTAAPVAVAEGL